MTSTAKRRLLAGLIDLALLLAWALLAGAAILWLASAGALGGIGLLGVNLAGIAAVVLPVTVGLTALEAGRYEATPGKLRFGLRVRHDPGGERIGWARSLARNLLKLGLPWTLLHLAAVSSVVGGGPSAWVGLALALAVPCGYLVSLVHGDGRTVYDRLAATMVISTEPGRRFADD
ncbi:RDD family protein [Propionicimonas sp.]|uniref:RDD family protein n=1 Tax=Propionicimonas sp. TaxID=1955623 RepID=UPI0039E43510